MKWIVCNGWVYLSGRGGPCLGAMGESAACKKIKLHFMSLFVKILNVKTSVESYIVILEDDQLLPIKDTHYLFDLCISFNLILV